MISDNQARQLHNLPHTFIRNSIKDGCSILTGADITAPLETGQVVGDITLRYPDELNQFRHLSLFVQYGLDDSESGRISQSLEEFDQDFIGRRYRQGLLSGSSQGYSLVALI